MTTNGHDPEVTDLGALLERTRPARVVRIPRALLDARALTTYELATIGRALNMTPQELVAAIAAQGWDATDVQGAIVWIVLRREEPDLTLAEVRGFTLEQEPEPDPTPAVSGPPGTAGQSKPPLPRAFHPARSER